MSCDSSEWHRLSDHLSAIKLASQLLSRRADLPEDQRLLLETLMNRADALSNDLAATWQSEPNSRPLPLFR